MPFDVEKESFDRQGFVIVRQFLGDADLASLRANLDRYIRDVVPTLSDSDAFYQDRGRPETLKQLHNMAQDDFFDEYMRHPKWVALAESLVGEPVQANQPEWFNKPPGTEHITPPHQDNYYFCLTPPHVVTIWCAVDTVDDENGVLRYVAGSHRSGFRPHAGSDILGFSQSITDYGPADEAREVRVSLAPGDVLAHHGMTIHRADPNRSTTRHRRAFAMVFKGESCRRDEAAFARYQASVHTQHQSLGITS